MKILKNIKKVTLGILGATILATGIIACSSNEENESYNNETVTAIKTSSSEYSAMIGNVHNIALHNFIYNYDFLGDKETATKNIILDDINNFCDSEILTIMESTYGAIPKEYTKEAKEHSRNMLEETKLLNNLYKAKSDFKELKNNNVISNEFYDDIILIINETSSVISAGKNNHDNDYINKINNIYSQMALKNTEEKIIANSILSIANSSNEFWSKEFSNGGFPAEDEEGNYGYTTFAAPVAADVGGAVVGVAGYALVSGVTGNEMSWEGAGVAAVWGAVTASVGAAVKVGKYLGKAGNWLWNKIK